jgi:uncharacterized protein
MTPDFPRSMTRMELLKRDSWSHGQLSGKLYFMVMNGGSDMITESIKRLIESTAYAVVASADSRCRPHLATGRDLRVPDPDHLVLEAWFCITTLQNVATNPRVAVIIADPVTSNGYQLLGHVERSEGIAMMDGYAPEAELPGIPQVQSRLVVRVDTLMAYSAGVHSDLPMV